MRLILIFFCLFSLPLYSATLKDKIIKECIEYTDDEIIENKAPKCKKAIAAYLQKVLADKIPRFDQGLYSVMSIALRSEMPEAYQFIEKEIYDGHLNSWIDKLEELNFELYGNSLIKWAKHVESEVRKIYKVEQNRNADYNFIEEPIQTTPELISIWSPILMTKYLDFLTSSTHRLQSDDFSSINIIYAFSNPSFRDVFAERISSAILKASDKWVNSIRKEQTWVLFRLFPLFSKNADGNIKRELIWLEKYHKDFRIRSMASSTLIKIAS